MWKDSNNFWFDFLFHVRFPIKQKHDLYIKHRIKQVDIIIMIIILRGLSVWLVHEIIRIVYAR